MKLRSDRTVDHPTLLFVHLPKTAGTTLKGIIRAHYGSRRVFEVTAGRIHQSLLGFGGLPEEKRAAVRAVIGHMPIGVDRLIPRPSSYVTLLRDPVERVVSDFFFIEQEPRHPLHREVASGQVTLEGFVASRLDNVLTRRLCSSDPLSGDYWRAEQSVDEGMLEEAKANLSERFSVVGISERFEESLLLVAHAFGWRALPLYANRNVTKNRPGLDQIDEAILATVRERCTFDLALYEYATKLFEEQLAETAPQLGEGMRREVRPGLGRLASWSAGRLRRLLHL
jgi:hypothetical protein